MTKEAFQNIVVVEVFCRLERGIDDTVDSFDDQIQGQMSIADLFEPPEKLFAVSRIFARARKDMSLAEQKTFVYALSEMRFTEEAESDCVKLDKKTLARILGITTADIGHLSVNLYDEIKELPRHSYIEINEKDLDLYSSGFIVTAVTRFRNVVRLRFNREYLGLFTGMSRDYITMWSADIFQMKSKRSVQFYEYLRQRTDTRKEVNSEGLGIRAFKELFEIPKDGKGSYMRESGSFNRSEFEKKVIQPLCDDLKNCKMIHLIVQSDGKLYEKVKQGNRVAGYRFYWTFTSHPAIASPAAVQQIPKAQPSNEDQREKQIANDTPRPVILAKETKAKEKKPRKKNSFDYDGQRDHDFDALERALLNQGIERNEDK